MFDVQLSDPAVLIAGATLIVILSYLFGRISKRTRVPSVLMLIATGVLISLGLKNAGVAQPDLMPTLEILGILGAIIIVLEAALDLQLDRNKVGVIGRAFLISLLTLVGTAVGVAIVFRELFQTDLLTSILYAVPLGILSSVILIPSIEGLSDKKKEGLVYETSFSDILGIMLFYFLVNMLDSGGLTAVTEFGVGLVVTIIVALAACYGLVYVFKDIKDAPRLLLLTAGLLLLYALGQMFKLTPLLMILVFGLFLSNHDRFFSIFKNWDDDEDPVAQINEEFNLITKEVSFVIRTFFFVIFGMTIDLSSLVNIEVLLVSIAVLAVIYVVRFSFLRFLLGRDMTPEAWLAPRGLMTILLFFSIPDQYRELIANKIHTLEGVFLYVIILTSVIMTFALVRHGRGTVEEGISGD